MFTILTLKKSPNVNFLNRFTNYFKRPNYTIESEKIDKGMVVLVEIFKPNKIKWKSLMNDLGKFNNKVLVEDNINLPINSFKLYLDNEFSIRNMLYNSKTLICNMDVDIKNKNVVFYDINGIYSSFLNSIILDVNRILIITAKVDYYNEISKEYFDDYGVIIDVKQEFVNLKEYPIMVLTNDIKIPISYKGLVISDSYDNQNCNCINNFDYEIPQKYSMFSELNINKKQLLNCLYSTCKSYELEKIKPIYCNFNNQKVLFKEICSKINLILK